MVEIQQDKLNKLDENALTNPNAVSGFLSISEVSCSGGWFNLVDDKNKIRKKKHTHITHTTTEGKDKEELFFQHIIKKTYPSSGDTSDDLPKLNASPLIDKDEECRFN